MDFSFQIVIHCHKFIFFNTQVVKHPVSFIFVLPNIAENGFGEVLDHIFSLCLLLFENGLHISQVAVRLPLENRTATLIFKFIIF